MKLRKSNINDLTTILSWIKTPDQAKGWAGPYIRFPTDVNKLCDDIDFKNAQSFTLVHENGELLGFAQIRDRFNCHHIACVIVNPQLRGQKIGIQLISSLLEVSDVETAHIPKRDHSLFVVMDNIPALKTYQKLGFQPCEWPKGISRDLPNCQFMKRSGL